MAQDGVSEFIELAEFQAEDRKETVSALSRRSLLKYGTMTGITGFVGRISTNEVASATETTETPTATEDIIADLNDCGYFNKVLYIKGIGGGNNNYYIETSGDIISYETADNQQGQPYNTVIEGNVCKDCFDSYFFNGKVMNVYIRGSISYRVFD